jgi:hypothetical protein
MRSLVFFQLDLYKKAREDVQCALKLLGNGEEVKEEREKLLKLKKKLMENFTPEFLKRIPPIIEDEVLDVAYQEDEDIRFNKRLTKELEDLIINTDFDKHEFSDIPRYERNVSFSQLVSLKSYFTQPFYFVIKHSISASISRQSKREKKIVTAMVH